MLYYSIVFHLIINDLDNSFAYLVYYYKLFILDQIMMTTESILLGVGKSSTYATLPCYSGMYPPLRSVNVCCAAMSSKVPARNSRAWQGGVHGSMADVRAV